jgi:hypothetical protein
MLSPEGAEALRKLTAVPAKVSIDAQQLEALRKIAGTSFQASLTLEQTQALRNLLAVFAPATLNTEQAESLESLLCELTRAVDWSQTGEVENFVNAFLQSPRLKRLHKPNHPRGRPSQMTKTGFNSEMLMNPLAGSETSANCSICWVTIWGESTSFLTEPLLQPTMPMTRPKLS